MGLSFITASVTARVFLERGLLRKTETQKLIPCRYKMEA
jgi:hypothetical protein